LSFVGQGLVFATAEKLRPIDLASRVQFPQRIFLETNDGTDPRPRRRNSFRCAFGNAAVTPAGLLLPRIGIELAEWLWPLGSLTSHAAFLQSVRNW
jgi:hypothetical protein